MTACQVADLLQISLRTVRRLIADGRLPAMRTERPSRSRCLISSDFGMN